MPEAPMAPGPGKNKRTIAIAAVVVALALLGAAAVVFTTRQDEGGSATKSGSGPGEFVYEVGPGDIVIHEYEAGAGDAVAISFACDDPCDVLVSGAAGPEEAVNSTESDEKYAIEERNGYLLEALQEVGGHEDLVDELESNPSEFVFLPGADAVLNSPPQAWFEDESAIHEAYIEDWRGPKFIVMIGDSDTASVELRIKVANNPDVEDDFEGDFRVDVALEDSDFFRSFVADVEESWGVELEYPD